MKFVITTKIIAVSYTHLDVYKRQVLSFDVGNLYVQVCKLFIDLQVIFRHFPWWSIVTAVSYTHLDVYKRQP